MSRQWKKIRGHPQLFQPTSVTSCSKSSMSPWQTWNLHCTSCALRGGFTKNTKSLPNMWCIRRVYPMSVHFWWSRTKNTNHGTPYQPCYWTHSVYRWYYFVYCHRSVLLSSKSKDQPLPLSFSVCLSGWSLTIGFVSKVRCGSSSKYYQTANGTMERFHSLVSNTKILKAPWSTYNTFSIVDSC